MNSLQNIFQNVLLKTLLSSQNPPSLQNISLSLQDLLPIDQLTATITQILQSQLIQKIVQEKLRNQILMNALLIKSQITESQIQINHQLLLQNNQGAIDQNRGILQGDTNSKLRQSEDGLIKDQQKQLDYQGLAKFKTAQSTSSSQLFKKPIRKIKNQTKNIPKNFGKAIITFIEKNQKIVRRILLNYPDIQYDKFIISTIQRRKGINSIADLRNLWLDEYNEYASPVRVLSVIFLKKHSLAYIFNSRVSNFEGHIKYRYRLMQALRDPTTFTCIKIF